MILTSVQLVAKGTLRVHFTADAKIGLLDFSTLQHDEYVPRKNIAEASKSLDEWHAEWHKVNQPAEGKQSPEMNKKGKARPMKSPPTAPPKLEIPESRMAGYMGVTNAVAQFLEVSATYDSHHI